MSFSKAVIRYQTTISFLSFHRYGWETQSNRIQCVKKGRWKTSTICQNLSTHSFTLNRENFSLKLQIKNKLVKDTKHVYPNQGISSKFQIKDKLVLQEKYLVLHPNCRTARWRRREQLNGILFKFGVLAAANPKQDMQNTAPRRLGVQRESLLPNKALGW